MELDESALTELSRYPWPGNVRELRNVLERAVVMFPDQTVSSTQVRENLLRMKAPDRAEEMSALWEASQDLMGIDIAQDQRAAAATLRHCRLVQLFRRSIDLRRHLRDIEVVLVKLPLEKSDGMVSQAAEALKLRHDADQKMKKLMIERPSQAESSGTAAE